MKEKFIQFLKDNGALEKFEANIRDKNVRWGDDNFTTINEYFDEASDPSTLVGAAFIWFVADGGSDFWGDIDDKWQEELCKSN